MPDWLRCGQMNFAGLLAVAIGIATALSVAFSH
jgi:hypothetical protein